MVHCNVWDKYSHTFEQPAAIYGLKEVNYVFGPVPDLSSGPNN